MTFSWFVNFAMSIDNSLGVLNKQTAISNKSDFKLVHNFRNQIIAIGVGSNTILVDNPSLNTKPNYIDGKKTSHPVKIIFDRRGRVEPSAKIFLQSNTPIIWVTNVEKDIDNEMVYFVDAGTEIDLKEMKFQIEEILSNLGYEEGAIMIEGGSQIIYNFIAKGLISRLRVFTSSFSVDQPGVDLKFPGNIEYKLLSTKMINSGFERIYAIEKK